MRTIKLNQVYITTFGKEFTPVSFEKGKLRKNYGLSRQIGEREEKLYIDKYGNRIKKSKLSFIKGEIPPKKLTSTI